MEWWAFICHLLVNKGSTPCVEVVVSGREGGREGGWLLEEQGWWRVGGKRR